VLAKAQVSPSVRMSCATASKSCSRRPPGRTGWAACCEDAGIKIDSVASSIVTKSGRAMRVAAIPGDPVPDVVLSAVSGVAVVPPQSVVVHGSAARSRDSRQWGFITAQDILGVVRARRAAEPER
jgi:type IV secretory pathway protease TraF